MLYINAVSAKLMELTADLQRDIVLKDYILGGGTALALQLGHRTSKDIDLFTTEKQDNNKLIEYFNKKFKSFDVVHIDTYILRLVIHNISVDLMSTNQVILEPPIEEGNIRLFGIKDIAPMKLRAILLRNEPKDYIDIAFILKNIPLKTMFDLYKEKYSTSDILFVKKSLASCENIDKNELESIQMLAKDINVYDVPKIILNEISRYNSQYVMGKKSSLLDWFKKAPPVLD